MITVEDLLNVIENETIDEVEIYTLNNQKDMIL